MKPHHCYVLTELLCQIDGIDGTIARFDAQIHAICGPVEEVVSLLETIPGVARRAAEMIVAEIGTDMTRFPSAAHLASWAGDTPPTMRAPASARRQDPHGQSFDSAPYPHYTRPRLEKMLRM